jgi:hypothetical protein
MSSTPPPLPPSPTTVTTPGVTGRGARLRIRGAPPPPPPKVVTTTTPAATSSMASTASTLTRSPTIFPPNANVTGITIDPKTAFPVQYQEIVALKQQIATLTQQVRNAEAAAATTAEDVKALGALNIGNTSFRGKNSPSVYAAYNAAANDYVARGDFSINGFPFRVQNANSFNAVLAGMKEKREFVTQTLTEARQLSTAVKGLQTQVQKLDTNLKAKTAKLRKNVANASSKALQAQRKSFKTAIKPSYVVKPGSGPSVTALNTALKAPQKGFFSRMFGRGGKTRRNNRR